MVMAGLAGKEAVYAYPDRLTGRQNNEIIGSWPCLF